MKKQLLKLNCVQTIQVSRLTFILPVLLIVLFTLPAAFAQKQDFKDTRWLYVTLGGESAKYYIRDDIEKLSKNLYRSWDRTDYPNGTHYISRTEWNCQDQKMKRLNLTLYDEDDNAVASQQFTEWEMIVADTVGEMLLARVCGTTDLSYQVEIEPQKANLRERNDLHSRILRVAVKGEQFRIVNQTLDKQWYNVVDEVTQQDYWVHQSVVKVVRKAG